MSFHAAVFIATSLDGYIARPDGSIDWLTERGEQAGDTGYDEFMASIDTVVLGRKTYELVLSFDFWPYDGKQVEVLSRRSPRTPTSASSCTGPSTGWSRR